MQYCLSPSLSVLTYSIRSISFKYDQHNKSPSFSTFPLHASVHSTYLMYSYWEEKLKERK
jgi:hypothetical protein